MPKGHKSAVEAIHVCSTNATSPFPTITTTRERYDEDWDESAFKHVIAFCRQTHIRARHRGRLCGQHARVLSAVMHETTKQGTTAVSCGAAAQACGVASGKARAEKGAE